ncbi:MAG TPA: zinc-binding dehydrogenase [Candidatus Dormibacteraeota bacterium]
MRAVYAARVGGDDPLANLEVGDVPEVELRAGWAMVHFAAGSLNHHDLWTLRGFSATPIVPPQVLGSDLAGTLFGYADEPPDDVPQPGSRVVVHGIVRCGHCAACRGEEAQPCRTARLFSETPVAGTFSDQVLVPAQNLVALPDSVSFEAAACLPTAYLTAYHMLFVRAALRPGMNVLVHGVTGGVASAAIILARLAGITVFATSRDKGKRALARELGATEAFAPERETARALIARTDGMGVDAVIETVGEPTWELSLRAVRVGGTIVVAGATGGMNPPAQLNRIYYRNVTVAGSSMGPLAELRRLVELCASGRLQPLIGSTYPMEAAPDAFREMASGELRGKVVLI